MAEQTQGRKKGIVAHVGKDSGFIATNDGTVYFFQCRGVRPPLHAVVTFDPMPAKEGRPRPRAVNIDIEAMAERNEEVA